MDDTVNHSLLLSFDTEDGEFARGFEAGRVWALLRAHPDEKVEEYVHAANAEMLLRMGEATGRAVRAEDVDDTWVLVTFAAAVQVGSAP